MDEGLIGLRKMYGGFQPARVIITANGLGVFDALISPKSADELALALKADGRATAILLNALTGIGLLIKKNGQFKNAPLANKYLVKGKPLYQGDIIRHAGNMWQSWSTLDEVMSSGRPVPRAGGFDHESFIMGMHNLSVLRAKDVLKAIGLRGVKTALDLGGGPGTYSMEMARKGIAATLFDTPDTVRIAKRLAGKEGVAGIKYLEGDFFADGIGNGYDLILISQIFHAYSEEDNIEILRKCREALNPNGRVFIHEFPINEEHTAPPHAALFSVNMLVGTESGRCYSTAEIKGWLLKTGYGDIKISRLEDTVLVGGRIG